MPSAWEDSKQGWVPQRMMYQAQPRILFRTHPKSKAKASPGGAAGFREKSNTKTQLSHVAIFMFERAFKLVYGKYGWPLHYTCEANTSKNEEKKLTQWQFGWTDDTPQNNLWKKICTHQSISEVKPSCLRSSPNSSRTGSSPSLSASKTGSVPAMT